VQAPIVLTEDTRELAADVGGDAVETLEALAKEEQSTFVARVSPATEARQGEKIELVVETTRLHFFDPESGRGIYGDEDG
jgi:multiple sugar transport system ATP-binding protein